MGGCTVRNTVVQVAGRLAPHVVDVIKTRYGNGAKCDITFCNVTQAKLCFCITIPSGTYVRTLFPGSLHMLSVVFPPWLACISQPSALYYKILRAPESEGFRTQVNKNSCCMLYADGRMRFHGAIRDCARMVIAIREALYHAMLGQYCKGFLSRLAG